MTGGGDDRRLFQLRATIYFFGVSHDATLRATVAEGELDPTSAAVARNVARKVASCVRAFRVFRTERQYF